jgi:hypothetical protein
MTGNADTAVLKPVQQTKSFESGQGVELLLRGFAPTPHVAKFSVCNTDEIRGAGGM